MTPAQAQRELERAGRALKRELMTAANQAIDRGYSAARGLSSGPLSLKELARRDHPYARRHGPQGNVAQQPRLGTYDMGYQGPGGINVQTGQFKAQWEVDHAQPSDRGVTAALFNDDEKADLLKEGTRFMVPRPIEQVVEERVAKFAVEAVDAAAKRIAR